MEYSLISKELTKKISKLEKKNNGIYFTPPSCVNNNIQLLQPYLKDVVNVLEPSCGSGEYITALHNSFPQFKITGIEYNETIYTSILQLKSDNVDIYHMDYLKYTTDKKYDLVIGNPPYFVLKKDAVDKEYHTYFEGRPNIFILFIIKSSQLLTDNGILSFVLPKNFLNCLYYDKTRKYINKHFQILHIVDCKADKYMETQQETVILILRKNLPVAGKIKKKNTKQKKYRLILDEEVPEKDRPQLAEVPEKDRPNTAFILEIKDYTIFTDTTNILKFTELYKNSKSLHELGFKVSVGNVVWNQCKEILTDDKTKTRLIYSSDIVDNELILKIYNNEEKKHFINKKGITRPMIVINRGYGVGEYKFNYCLIEDEHEYLIENHLICIEYNGELPRAELIQAYKKILFSLTDERTIDFINVYFGNNAINTTELNHILPIY